MKDYMKFTKGLFLGTALGISAAMMMNNKAQNNKQNNNQGKYITGLYLWIWCTK